MYGSSDDLIEIDGDISEEFTLHDDDAEYEGDLLAFSNGVILRVRYSQSGVWRIVVVDDPKAVVKIKQAPEDDEDNYSDKVHIDDALVLWVVHGIGYARRK